MLGFGSLHLRVIPYIFSDVSRLLFYSPICLWLWMSSENSKNWLEENLRRALGYESSSQSSVFMWLKLRNKERFWMTSFSISECSIISWLPILWLEGRHKMALDIHMESVLPWSKAPVMREMGLRMNCGGILDCVLFFTLLHHSEQRIFCVYLVFRIGLTL